MKTKYEKAFLKDLRELCKKHGLVLVPTYEDKLSAHDPMAIVELDDFWLEFISDRVLSQADQKEIGIS